MKTPDFTTTLLVDQTPKKIFNTFNNVSSVELSTVKCIHCSGGKTAIHKTGKVWMRKVQTIAVIVCLLYPFAVSAQTTQNPTDTNIIEPLPRDLEIKLALSALPQHLRDSATVYVLNPDKGFEVAREGSNGFHAFVARTGDDAMRGSWPLKEYRDDILYPISFDQAGVKAQMQVFFDIAEMQANGIPASELKKIIKKRYKTGYYKAPERSGISYMLSPILRTYVNPETGDRVLTTNNPHIMYYAPNVTNQDIGGVKPSINPYPFIINQGPHGYFIQHVGEQEKAAINKEYETMLARLCEIKEEWCLPISRGQ